MSSGADPSSGRAAVTNCFRGFFLAIAAFHSESTRARLHPGQFHRTLEELLVGADTTAQARGLDGNLYQQAKYAVIALADDLGLHSDWDGASQWNRYLLELRHFNTSFAGQEFFERLNRLRQTLAGVQDPALREQVLGTLEVYYTCLRLGFRGRYRSAQSGEVENAANAVLALILPAGGASRSRTWGDAYREAPKGKLILRGMWWWWPIPLSFVAAAGVWFLLSAGQIGRVNKVVESTTRSDAAGERR